MVEIVTKLDQLRTFAEATVARHRSLQLPSSASPRALSEYYVDLKVTDSAGRTSRISELGSLGPRLVLVGDPGSGKTTALRYLALRQSELFLSGDSDLLAIYVGVRELDFTCEFPIARAIGLEAPILRQAKSVLLIDGLDEVASEQRSATLSEIEAFSEAHSPSQVVVASRPAGLSPPPPDDYRFFHLASLDTIQAREFISRLTADPTLVAEFEATVESAKFLEGISRNPLLLRLMWEVFRSEARLPSVRADLYQTVSDFLLSSWDNLRGISRTPSQFDLASVHNVLETLALETFRSSRHHFSIRDLHKVINGELAAQGLEVKAAEKILDQLLVSGVLVQSAPDMFSFMHLTFLEFYVAKRLVRSAPDELNRLVVASAPETKEVILFAAGMVLDVGPLVEAAVDRRELILAVNCLREGRTENRVIEAYVLDQLQRELGPDLIRKLSAGLAHKKAPQPESIHSVLHRTYLDSQAPDLPSHKKGKKFERFAERFFQQAFEVVDINTNTENGEIDLILENTATDPFWYEFGGDIFVECKNWDTSRPLKETAAFANKVRMARGRLGFFVSVSGFTEDAVRTLKNQVADRDAPLVVPISGHEIVSMLEHRERFDLFFKEAIRKIKHLHKW